MVVDTDRVYDLQTLAIKMAVIPKLNYPTGWKHVTTETVLRDWIGLILAKNTMLQGHLVFAIGTKRWLLRNRV